MSAELLPILLVITLLFGVSLAWRLSGPYRSRFYAWVQLKLGRDGPRR